MASAHVQRVPKLLLAVNEWIAAGKIDKAQGGALSNLVLMKHEPMMLLADEIGTTDDAALLAKALAVAEAASSAASAVSSSPTSGPRNGPRKGRPALDIGAVKDANASAEAAAANAEESQADALLKAKRERALKRQSLPEKTGLPSSVADQIQP